MDTEQRRARGAALLEKMLGAEDAGQLRELWKELAPDFEQYVVEFVAGEVWSREGLDLRTKGLATIAALAALGRTLALELNIRIALNNGATREEIVETLLHIAPYAGFPAAWEGLTMAGKVFRSLDDET